MAIVPIAPPKMATKPKLSAYTLRIIDKLQAEEAVLVNRLSYAHNRREVERQYVEAELKKVQAAIAFMVG